MPRRTAAAFPRGRHDPESDKATAFTGVDVPAKKAFGDGGPGPNDVTAAFFLLVQTQELSCGLFVCPSSSQVEWEYGGNGKTARDHSNFPDAII